MENQFQLVRQKSSLPHMEWMNIKNDGTLIECAIMKEDKQGNIYHIPITSLDDTDRSRLAKLITNRNAQNFELWDLMQQTTLGNGINALEYFHQLVKVLTPQGTIIDPIQGRRGFQQTGVKQVPQAAAPEAEG